VTRLTEALQRERIVPRFVDSYVVEHGRQFLQVHAALYRDLLGLLQREALLAASVRAMELVSAESPPALKSKPGARKGAALFPPANTWRTWCGTRNGQQETRSISKEIFKSTKN